MTTARIELPAKLIPVFDGEADVRAAYGGRGSGKTRSFAKMTAVRTYMWDQAHREGVILCGRQFMNSLVDSSLEEVKAAISSEPWLRPHFDIGEKYVKTKSGRISYVFSGLDRNIDSIKSMARILLCWVDEAEPVTETAWQKLIPTLREEDSELWVTWNPERRNSATHKRFREAADPRYKVAEINWRDNPAFPAVLERQRERDQARRPDQYEHIWEGDFVTVIEGAYYAKDLTKARLDGRIGRVGADPLMVMRAFWDIGGAGLRSDASAIWIAQFVGREIRILDYHQSQGQPLAADVAWMRSRGYDDALCILPHDGTTVDRVYAVSYESALRDAGFSVQTIPNQGPGAYMLRIEAARRLFPMMWFNEETTRGGVSALGLYHERRDEKTGVGLGAKHDDASHAADAFGLMAVSYEGLRMQDDWMADDYQDSPQDRSMTGGY